MLYSIFKEEFLLLFAKIDSLQKRSPATFGIALLESKARDQAFHLQGLLRLLIRNKAVSAKKLKRLEKILKYTKSLEDALGRMDEALALEKNIQTQQKKVDANPLVRSQSAVVQTLALKTFGSQVWAQEQLDNLSFFKKWSDKKSVKVIKFCLREELERLTEKTTSELLPKIEKSALSYDIMELYFHEFRRALRWIPIYVQTLHSFFSLTPYDLNDAESAFEKRILRKYKGNPFTEISSPHPYFQLDRFSFYMFSHSIENAGYIKDTIEMYYKLKDLKIKAELDTIKYKKEMIELMIEFLESGAIWRLYDSLNTK